MTSERRMVMLGCCARSSVACVLLATALAGCVSLPERDVSIELCKRVEIGDPLFCADVEFEVYVNVLLYTGLRMTSDDVAGEVVRLANISDSFPPVDEDDDMEYDSSQFYFVVLIGDLQAYVVGFSSKDDVVFLHSLNSPLRRIKAGYMFYPSLEENGIRVCKNDSLCERIRQEVNRRFKRQGGAR